MERLRHESASAALTPWMAAAAAAASSGIEVSMVEIVKNGCKVCYVRTV